MVLPIYVPEDLRFVRTFFEKLKKYWYLTVYLVLSLFCLVGVFIPPTVFWPAVFASYAIPGILILSTALFVLLMFVRKRLLIFPGLVMIGGLPFLLITYSFNEPVASKDEDITLMSFNAKLFRAYKTYDKFDLETIQWAAKDDSDIKCFQEYSTNARWRVLDVTGQIQDKGYKGFVFSADVGAADHFPGMAIFTKHQILDSGFVWNNAGTTNAGQFMDVIKNEDTLRVYNVHLESMYLKLYQFKELDRYYDKIKYAIRHLKEGAEKRSDQIDKIVAHAQSSPYPFVICGDFNETPYSYNYIKLRSIFNNSFEEVGNGFGFTFNSILFFLRIDHHFYGDGVEAVQYRVDKTIKTSDHFVTRGVYRVSGSR